MKVSIYSAPEIIITDLTHYLPENTTELIITNNSQLFTAAFDFAHTNHIPLTELGATLHIVSPYTTAEKLAPLLAKSEHLVIFSNHFSDEMQQMIAYCKQEKVSFSVFQLMEFPQ